ncbi:uncharacterized protein LOC143250491 isoform X2 [Tachypleus tridentatus]|uniref:uncharacterized protein LOC143250491 isoform X2 n=1 Tax=Tachypleus tridentatus TaxID=6853 RepID=UPI003FD025EA
MSFSVLPTLFVLIFAGIYADDEAIVFPESNTRTSIDSNNVQRSEQPFDLLRSSSGSQRKKEIPESILIKLKDVKNVTEFMKHFLTRIPLQGRLGPFLSAIDTSKTSYTVNSLNITAGSKMAMDRPLPFLQMSGDELAPSAGCEPESQIVELPKPVDPLTVIWPPCTRIKKCGGCCPSTLLECVPKQTSKLSVKVIKAKYPKAGAETFEFQSFEVVKLEVHEKCSCECKEKRFDCSSQQTYKADECRCVCMNHMSSENCGDNQIWDSKDCSCKCKNYSNCSTGFYFNPESCRITELLY